jgi:mannose-6-phosphate isomerase
MKMYKFKPILKQTLWGGEKIAALKNLKNAPKNIGESWEVSGVEGDVSIVFEGEHIGMSLTQLIEQQQEALVGVDNYRRFGTAFPLLIKFIDACQDLSIQVHPTDEQAQAVGKPFGKTEMWVVMEGSSPDASLRVGLQSQITPEEYKQRVADNTICDVIKHYPVSEGDCFFLPAGRIHSIGAGCLLLEIQQTSDITYRIYDFNRRDVNGQLRQLHTEEAAACIDYLVEDDYQTHYQLKKNELTPLVSCPYFTTEMLDMRGTQRIDLSSLDSFLLVMALHGCGTLTDSDGFTLDIKAGETILVAAAAEWVELEGALKVVTASVK